MSLKAPSRIVRLSHFFEEVVAFHAVFIRGSSKYLVVDFTAALCVVR
jgi:hypothetical protein